MIIFAACGLTNTQQDKTFTDLSIKTSVAGLLELLKKTFYSDSNVYQQHRFYEKIGKNCLLITIKINAHISIQYKIFEEQ